MPMFDVEYIFLKVRAKSVGEISKLKLLCPDDKETYTEGEVNLEDVQVHVEEGHTNKIELGEMCSKALNDADIINIQHPD